MEPEGGGRSDEALWRSLIDRLELTGVGVLCRPETRGPTRCPVNSRPHLWIEHSPQRSSARMCSITKSRPTQLASLISTVHEALGRLGRPTAEPTGERTPAVSIRRSVRRDHVVCLDCGWRGQMLRRHLTSTHGLTVDAYRARWNLPSKHAMTAPAYSELRSTMAKQIGLGQTRGARLKQ